MNLTQEQVARDFFIIRQTISSWENEKTYPDIASLIKLSDYYHISLDTLLKEYSGMKEYLEKKNVEKALMPMIIILAITNFSFLLFLATNILNQPTVILLLGVLNAIALIQLLTTQLRLRRIRLPDKKIDLLFFFFVSALGILFILFSQRLFDG